ncbi:MAG: hypothetical protein ING75_17085 [Rhodocyclaceae bacterium]|nr:hypothetical protein [Rhodocyclaceae bacterium]
MATLEETIVSVVTPVFGAGRLFYIEADEQADTATDYCVFSIVGSDDPANTLTEFSRYTTARVQFTILARRAINLATKAKALREAMAAANASRTLQCRPLGAGFDLPSDDSLLFARVVEYQITSYDPLA